MAKKKDKRVVFENKNSICCICNVQIGVGNNYEWVHVGEAFIMRHPGCDASDYKVANTPTDKAQKAPVGPSGPAQATLGLGGDTNATKPTQAPSRAVIDTMGGIITAVNQQNAFIGDALGKVSTALDELNMKIDKSAPVQVMMQDAPASKPVSGTHPQFRECLNVLMASRNLYMVGPRGTGKSTIARHLAEALGAKLFKLTPGTPTDAKSVHFGFDGPNGYSGSILRDFIAHDGPKILYFEEIDNTTANIQVSLHDLLDCCRESRSAELSLTANVIEELKSPDKAWIVANGNTSGYGGEMNHASRRPMDGATIDRFYFVEVAYDTELEERIAVASLPKNPTTAKRWTRYVQAMRPLALEQYPRLVPGTRAIQDGVAMLATGAASLKTRSTAFDLARGALFSGIPADVAERLHRDAWAASEGKA